jgi:hypothetical protein
MSLVCIILVPIYRDADQKNMLTRLRSPSLSRDACRITHTHTGSLAAATLPAQHATLPHHTPGSRGRSRSRFNPTFLSVCCTTHLSRAQTAPHHTAQHSTAQHSTALHSPRHTARHAPVHATRPCTLHSTLCSARCSGLAVFRLPYRRIAVSSTEPPVPSPQYTNIPPNLTQPNPSPISQSPGSALRFDGAGG